MSDEEQKKLKAENLIYRLNSLGVQRQQKFDELWELEKQSEKLRRELIQLLDHGLENI